jgi:hypothetical protein
MKNKKIKKVKHEHNFGIAYIETNNWHEFEAVTLFCSKCGKLIRKEYEK